MDKADVNVQALAYFREQNSLLRNELKALMMEELTKQAATKGGIEIGSDAYTDLFIRSVGLLEKLSESLINTVVLEVHSEAMSSLAVRHH